MLLPKIDTAGEVEQVARVFARRAPSGAVPPLLLLLETPRAILRAAEIAAADAPVAALLFGAEDYTASLAVERTIDGEELSHARAQIVLAAAAVDADAIYAVCTDLNDADSLRRDCQRAQKVLLEHKQRLVELADALLVRETLDAEQVRRIAAGLPLGEFVPAAGPTPAPPQEPKATKEKERPATVPPLSPSPVTQE